MNEDNERWWNFIVHDMPLTNAELNEFAPFMAILVIIVLVVGLIIYAFGRGDPYD